MEAPAGYYEARRAELLALIGGHASGWRPFLEADYGAGFAEEVIAAARRHFEAVVATLPYIGGDANPMTRHLVRSGTSLALYLAMRERGHGAHEAGHVVYRAVRAAVARLPREHRERLSEDEAAAKRREAALSQERRYADDWVWEFVQGEGEFGYDFLECGTRKLYLAHGAAEFLPYYCYLDFVTHRLDGWGFSRATTLAEGGDRCRFRYRRGDTTASGWPPPFAR